MLCRDVGLFWHDVDVLVLCCVVDVCGVLRTLCVVDVVKGVVRGVVGGLDEGDDVVNVVVVVGAVEKWVILSVCDVFWFGGVFESSTYVMDAGMLSVSSGGVGEAPSLCVVVVVCVVFVSGGVLWGVVWVLDGWVIFSLFRILFSIS